MGMRENNDKLRKKAREAKGWADKRMRKEKG